MTFIDVIENVWHVYDNPTYFVSSRPYLVSLAFLECVMIVLGAGAVGSRPNWASWPACDCISADAILENDNTWWRRCSQHICKKMTKRMTMNENFRLRRSGQHICIEWQKKNDNEFWWMTIINDVGTHRTSKKWQMMTMTSNEWQFALKLRKNDNRSKWMTIIGG